MTTHSETHPGRLLLGTAEAKVTALLDPAYDLTSSDIAYLVHTSALVTWADATHARLKNSFTEQARNEREMWHNYLNGLWTRLEGRPEEANDLAEVRMQILRALVALNGPTRALLYHIVVHAPTLNKLRAVAVRSGSNTVYYVLSAIYE